MYITYLTKIFQRSDGRWGLAYNSLSSWRGASALDAIIEVNGLVNVFSLCLVETNPIMSIGIDFSALVGVQYTTLLSETYYQGNQKFFYSLCHF